MASRRMLAALAAALLLAAPAPALAQSAGDEQYQDPFGGDSGGSGGGSGSSGGSGSQAPPATPAPATPAPAPAAPSTAPSATTAQADPSGAARSQLPYTGSPVAAGWLAALGATLVAGGLTLRLRLRERDGA